MPELRDLPQAELEVMEIVWLKGEVTGDARDHALARIQVETGGELMNVLGVDAARAYMDSESALWLHRLSLEPELAKPDPLHAAPPPQDSTLLFMMDE